MKNFGPVERIVVPHEPGGHFGGDPVLHRMLFKPGTEDPLALAGAAWLGPFPTFGIAVQS